MRAGSDTIVELIAGNLRPSDSVSGPRADLINEKYHDGG